MSGGIIRQSIDGRQDRASYKRGMRAGHADRAASAAAAARAAAEASAANAARLAADAGAGLVAVRTNLTTKFCTLDDRTLDMCDRLLTCLPRYTCRALQ